MLRLITFTLLTVVLACSGPSGDLDRSGTKGERKDDDTGDDDDEDDTRKGGDDDGDGSGSGSSGDQNDDSADEPQWVNSAYLTLDCDTLSADQDKGQYSVGCHLQDKDGTRVAPEKLAKTFSWDLKTTVQDLDYKLRLDDVPAEFDAVYEFGGTVPVAADDINTVELVFAYTEPATGDNKTLSSRMQDLLKALSDQNAFRLVIKSIRAHDPAKDLVFLNKIEFKVDGAWQEMTMDPETSGVRVGNARDRGNGQASDAMIFRNIFGEASPVLTPEAFTRFSASAPHDAVDEPLYLQFEFKNPISLSGLRYNGGQPMAGSNLASGFPDVVHMETKKDGQWTLVPGSEVNVATEVDADILEFLWNGSDL